MLVDLAEHKNDGFVSLKDISLRQDIVRDYQNDGVNEYYI
jgi:DNA-binding IscR family transcriptional regulator